MNKRIPSFRPLSDDGGRGVLSSAGERGLDLELLEEVVASFEGAPYEVALSLFEDALLIRIFDGEEYLFTSPVGLSSPWDMKRAVLAVRDYTVREMIPLRFTDVMREELDVYTELFRFVDARSYDGDGELFFLSVRSECDALYELPELTYGRIRLSAIREEDSERYRELSESTEVNRYWGYDVREDNPSGDIGYYLATAEGEFRTGTAITLGVYYGGGLIGEGVLFDFDMSGGATVALRLLPEYHGIGLGTETLEALIRVAKDIDLLYLTAEVMEENIPSIAMMDKRMKRVSSDGGRVCYYLEL